MSRMDKRRSIEAKKKKRRIKWMLAMAFAASTLLFYFFGPDFFGIFPWQREQVEPYRIIYDDTGYDVSFYVEEDIVFLPLSWVEENMTGERTSWITHCEGS